jgi:hypothetical protein
LLPLSSYEERELMTHSVRYEKMETDDLMRIVRGKNWVQEGLTLTLSNKKTYFLDAVGKRLRNVNDPYDSIDIEQLLRIKEYDASPKLNVRHDSIVMECKCGKWLFVNPRWRRTNKQNYPFRGPIFE